MARLEAHIRQLSELHQAERSQASQDSQADSADEAEIQDNMGKDDVVLHPDPHPDSTVTAISLQFEI